MGAHCCARNRYYFFYLSNLRAGCFSIFFFKTGLDEFLNDDELNR